jgi:DNA-binding NarL/FixJ family response regulator
MVAQPAGSQNAGMHNATSTSNSSATATVFIAEDSTEVRERLTDLLQAGGHLVVVGHAETPDGAIEGIRCTQPDCVVLDIHLLGGSGLEVLRRLHPQHPGIAFVVLTNHANAQYRKAFMKAGALCVLDKSDEFQKVRDTLLAACPGNKSLN